EHLGMYVATVDLADEVEGDTVLMYNEPGRMAAVHPATGRGIAAFIFRHPALPDFDHRDSSAHRDVVARTYAGTGGRVPDLLRQVREAPDIYFDSVSRVRMDTWSSGRIVLLGDAASCVSLLGDGSSLAIAGAATLSECVAAYRDDPSKALREYERRHRRL